MTIILAILLVGLIVCVHELGHFAAAKLCGVKVNEFAIFMGPAIVKWQGKETKYSIRCIPFGGFCAMEGEDEASDNPRAFTSAVWWKRVIILVAGVFMNVVLALVMFFLVMVPQQMIATTEVAAIEEGSYLQEGNAILPGDRLLEIDGEKLYLQNDFSLLLMIKGDGAYDVLVERNGEELLLEDVLLQKKEFVSEDGSVSLLYGISFEVEEVTFGGKLRETWNLMMYNARTVRLSLQMLFGGQASVMDLTGPVGMVDQIAQVTEDSETFLDTLLILLQFGGMLSVNLAILNLLPLPALDGGRAVCVLLTAVIELITRKKINPKYEGYIHAVGMILLLLLMVFILFKDVFMIFKG